MKDISKLLDGLKGLNKEAALETYRAARLLARRFGEVSGDLHNVFDLTVEIAGWSLNITYGDFEGMMLFAGGKSTFLKIVVDGHLFFAAANEGLERANGDPSRGSHEEQVQREQIQLACALTEPDQNGRRVILERYRPGTWQRVLTAQRVKTALKKKTPRNGTSHPFNIQKIAEDFGLPPV